MNHITLVSVVTENYLERARPFLESLRRLSGVDRFCVCQGFKPQMAFQIDCNHVDFIATPMHWTSDKGIWQHGRWLDALPGVRDDQLYILTDADITVQRDFTEAERVRLTDYDLETFGAAWDCGENDDLFQMAAKMGMTEGGDLFPMPWTSIPGYNTGVLAMRGRAWKRLRDLFECRAEGFWKVNPHRSRCQWLMCWCLHRLGLRADILPGSIHAHAHHGIPKGATVDNGVLRHNGETVLFRHAI
jgi:hypothetical protein